MRRTSFQSFTDGRQRSTSQPKARNSLAAFAVAGAVQYVTDPKVRREVRAALAHHLGLDLPARSDGAA